LIFWLSECFLSQVLSGFVNGIFLVYIGCSILREAIHRILDPPHIHLDKLLVVSTIGLCVNLFGMFAFSHAHSHGGEQCGGHSGGGGGHADHGHSHSNRGSSHSDHGHSHSDHGHSHSDHGHSHSSKHSHAHSDCGSAPSTELHTGTGRDENLFGVYLHVLADTLGSVGVIISTLLIDWFGWTIADPICSFILSGMILASVVPLLKSSSATLLQDEPDHVTEQLPILFDRILRIPCVLSVKEHHFWKLDGTTYVGTIIVRSTPDGNENVILNSVREALSDLGIANATIEIDKSDDTQKFGEWGANPIEKGGIVL
jgi:zinc transporter 5/7